MGNSRIEYDSKGIPVMAISGKRGIVMQTKPKTEVGERVKTGQQTTFSKIGNFMYVPWFDDNNFPLTAEAAISQNPVLTRALIRHSQIICGNGIVPVIVTGFDDQQNEITQIVNDPDITAFLTQSWVRKYLVESQNSMDKFGNAFVQFRLDLTGNYIAKLNVANGLYCRLEAPGDLENSKGIVYSGSFPDNTAKYASRYSLLDYYDPYEELDLLRTAGSKEKSFMFHLKNPFSGNIYYGLPDWYSAKKWVDISNKISSYVDAGLDNMLNITTLIRIPYAYWEQKYPSHDYDGNENERKQLIQSDIDTLIEEFTTPEKAKKTLITHFGGDESDPESGKWEIEIVQPKFSPEHIQNSTAADTQIALAAGTHPDMMGLMFGNSKGGSMQRELFLLENALSWSQRQFLIEPLEIALRFNFGTKYQNIELRFRNAFLTTLDTGKQTGTVLS